MDRVQKLSTPGPSSRGSRPAPADLVLTSFRGNGGENEPSFWVVDRPGRLNSGGRQSRSPSVFQRDVSPAPSHASSSGGGGGSRFRSTSIAPVGSEEERALKRRESANRLKQTWELLHEKYGNVPIEDDDEVDLLAGDAGKCVKFGGFLLRQPDRNPVLAGWINDTGAEDRHERTDDDELGGWNEQSGLDEQYGELPPPQPARFRRTEEDDEDLREFMRAEARRREIEGDYPAESRDEDGDESRDEDEEGWSQSDWRSRSASPATSDDAGSVGGDAMYRRFRSGSRIYQDIEDVFPTSSVGLDTDDELAREDSDDEEAVHTSPVSSRASSVGGKAEFTLFRTLMTRQPGSQHAGPSQPRGHQSTEALGHSKSMPAITPAKRNPSIRPTLDNLFSPPPSRPDVPQSPFDHDLRNLFTPSPEARSRPLLATAAQQERARPQGVEKRKKVASRPVVERDLFSPPNATEDSPASGPSAPPGMSEIRWRAKTAALEAIRNFDWTSEEHAKSLASIRERCAQQAPSASRKGKGRMAGERPSPVVTHSPAPAPAMISETASAPAQGGGRRLRDPAYYFPTVHLTPGGGARCCVSCRAAGGLRAERAKYCKGRRGVARCLFEQELRSSAPRHSQSDAGPSSAAQSASEADDSDMEEAQRLLQNLYRPISVASEPDADSIRVEVPQDGPGLDPRRYLPDKIRSGRSEDLARRCKACVTEGGQRRKLAAHCRGRTNARKKCTFELEKWGMLLAPLPSSDARTPVRPILSPSTTPDTEEPQSPVLAQPNGAVIQTRKRNEALEWIRSVEPHQSSARSQDSPSEKHPPSTGMWRQRAYRVRTGGAFRSCRLCRLAGGERRRWAEYCFGNISVSKCKFELDSPWRPSQSAEPERRSTSQGIPIDPALIEQGEDEVAQKGGAHRRINGALGSGRKRARTLETPQSDADESMLGGTEEDDSDFPGSMPPSSPPAPFRPVASLPRSASSRVVAAAHPTPSPSLSANAAAAKDSSPLWRSSAPDSSPLDFFRADTSIYRYPFRPEAADSSLPRSVSYSSDHRPMSLPRGILRQPSEAGSSEPRSNKRIRFSAQLRSPPPPAGDWSSDALLPTRDRSDTFPASESPLRAGSADPRSRYSTDSASPSRAYELSVRAADANVSLQKHTGRIPEDLLKRLLPVQSRSSLRTSSIPTGSAPASASKSGSTTLGSAVSSERNTGQSSNDANGSTGSSARYSIPTPPNSFGSNRSTPGPKASASGSTPRKSGEGLMLPPPVPIKQHRPLTPSTTSDAATPSASPPHASVPVAAPVRAATSAPSLRETSDTIFATPARTQTPHPRARSMSLSVVIPASRGRASSRPVTPVQSPAPPKRPATTGAAPRPSRDERELAKLARSIDDDAGYEWGLDDEVGEEISRLWREGSVVRYID